MSSKKPSDVWSETEERRQYQPPRATLSQTLEYSFGNAKAMYILGIVVLGMLSWSVWTLITR